MQNNILYACHGKLDSYSSKKYDFRKLRYHKSEDHVYTLDIQKKVDPDIWMNLKEDNSLEIRKSEFKEFFDIIILMYCPYGVFIEKNLSIKKSTFKNCYWLLKKRGLLYINNFRKYNKPTTRYQKSFNTPPEEFIKSISKYFRIYGLEKTEKRGVRLANETLILQKL